MTFFPISIGDGGRQSHGPLTVSDPKPQNLCILYVIRQEGIKVANQLMLPYGD